MSKSLILMLVMLSQIAINAHALTLSQLIAETRTLIFDGSSASRQRFTDSQIADILNQAQREAIAQTRCLRQSMTFSLVPGTTYYPLPSNYLAMERLTIGFKYLQEMSPAALDGRSRSWEAASGYPTYYFVNFSSPGMVGFAPWPATSADIDTIKMEYDIQATDMSGGSDLPFSGVSKMTDYHHALSYFAAAILSSIDNQSSKATTYFSVYSAVIASMTKRCLERPNYLPSATGTP